MPIYEYRCDSCQRKTSVLTLRVSETVEPTCRHCGGRAMHRLMSRFATLKSEDARLDALADPGALGDVDESDPKSMARWMRRMGKELGEDVAGDDFDEMVDEMEAGGGLDDAAPESTGGDDDL
jgi:putative FmdB family regulatory protein